jgi:hypothetical protein
MSDERKAEAKALLNAIEKMNKAGSDKVDLVKSDNKRLREILKNG